MADKEAAPKPAGSGRPNGSGWFTRLRCRASTKFWNSPACEQWRKAILLLGLSLGLALLLAPAPPAPLTHLKVGQIAREDLKASHDLLVEDADTTAKRQQGAVAQVAPVFDLDEQAAERIQEHLNQAMTFMRQQLARLGNPKEAGGGSLNQAAEAYQQTLEGLKPEFDRLLGVVLPGPTFLLLARGDFSTELEILANRLVEHFCRVGVISSRSLPAPETREILLRRLPSREEQKLAPPFPFVDLDHLRKPVSQVCRELAGNIPPADRWLVCDLVQYLLTPNVAPNLAETQERQQAALRQVKPAYFQVKKGELLVKGGERLTPLHLAKLSAQSQAAPPRRGVAIFLGAFLSLALLLTLSYYLAGLSLKNFSTKSRDLLFLAVLLLASTALCRLLLSLGDILANSRPELGSNLIYGWSMALAPMFAALFLGLETGLGMAFLSATLAALLLDKPFPIFLYFLSAGLVGIWGVRNCRQRADLIRAGLAIAVVNVVMVTAFKLLEYPFTLKELLIGQGFAVGGGLFTGIVALGFTPVVEMAFHYTSNIRLLELLNLDQPLLKDLMLLTPGTYHHSLIVGQMVEAAAEAIGANPLLAKAAAYYHDIGKLKKPLYFVENQIGVENRHEKLAPSMSSLIIIAHVKEGAELARKHHLGDQITDIIRQHHGTCLISYFFQKAKSLASNPAQVNIEDYRYPGPRPQTKEAGLVLIADQLEAASRTLIDPTPARVTGMVQKIVNNIFADGQLDECELTLKELHLIAKHCIKTLSGICHHRISYPQPAEKTRFHDHLDKQPSAKDQAKSGNHQDKGREDLRRLGMG
jgi:hypothetical protein